MKSLNVKRKIFLFLQFQLMFTKTSGAVCPFVMDLAFLMDASGSIGPHNYENMKKFINEVIDHFYVSSKGTHVGVVSFSSVARTEISFTDQQNVEKIKAAVSNISYYKGGTDLDEGLQESREKLFSAEHGMRANVPHVLLAFTDGISGKGIGVTKQESQHLKDDGIVIFAMGIGDNVNSAEIHALASDSSRVFQVTSTEHMLQAGYSLKIALALCSANRTSNAIIFPVVTQHSLKHHTVASRTTYDDLGCALMCIKHSSCYSFNFHTPSRLCELSYARRTDFPGDFYYDHGSVYSELDFEREV